MAGRPGVRTATLAPWVEALSVWLVSRVVSTAALLLAARGERDGSGAGASYATVTGGQWDATWWGRVATLGYPAHLPTGPGGAVLQNEWAFLPGFPLVARAVMSVTGLPWTTVGPTLALVLGAAAAVLVHRLVRVGAPSLVAERPWLPAAAVGAMVLQPAALVLQTGYAESAALLLLAGWLLALLRRRHGWAAALGAALALTRPVGPVLVLVAAVHLIVVARDRRRTTTPRPGLLAPAGVLVAVVAATLVWPVVCGAVTGVPDGYLRTEAAWRDGTLFAPFAGWWGHPKAVVVLVVVLAASVAVLVSAPGRRLRPELAAWSGGYVLYVTAVSTLEVSLLRFALLAAPLAVPALARLPRRRPWPWLAVLGVLGAASQLAWAVLVWRLVPGAPTRISP